MLWKSDEGFEAPINSLDDSNREIHLIDSQLLDYWPSIIDPKDLLF